MSLNTSSINQASSFKEIKELEFLSYYFDFKLVLCSICKFGLSSNTFQSHVQKHIKLYNKEQRSLLLSKALNILNNLEVSSLKESLELINQYSKSLELKAFKELEIRDLFICNLNTCSLVLSSEYRIKRHIREVHSSSSSNIDPSTSPYKVIKGQSLEANKYFFKVSLNSSSTLSILISNRSRSNSLEEDLIIKQAKEAFLNKYSKKEEQFNKELSNFKLNS
jgi:hypothetical protein